MPIDVEPWLWLRHLEGLSNRNRIALLRYTGDIRTVAALAGDPAIAPPLRSLLEKGPCPASVQRDLEWLAHPDRQLLVADDTGYPPLLREIPDPPLVLYVQGAMSSVQNRQIAVVGSRNPSIAGRETAFGLARDLGRCGWTITSGLALGIDAAAHAGAIAARVPTVAVLGTGLDRIYPSRHRELAQQICGGGGALVSEFSAGTLPRKSHFPQRNRIISGLSWATVVVEAGARSGSLITARLAGEQGREVCAVPGSIRSPLARGCHRLIRSGATLVESAQDVLAELQHVVPDGPAQNPRPVAEPPPADDPLLKAMGYDPVSVDELVARTGLTAAKLSSILLRMELGRTVAAVAGGRFQRLK